MPLDPGGAIVGWLVQLAGGRLVSAGDRLVFGGDRERKLRAAVSGGVRTVLAEVEDEGARESLQAVLRERFTEMPAVAGGGGGTFTQRLAEAVRAQVAPLADPEIALSNSSYLDQIGVSAGWLAERLTSTIIEAVRDVWSAADFDALAIRLGFEELREEMRGRARPAAEVVAPFMAPPLPRTFTERAEVGGRLLDTLLGEPAEPVVLTGAGGFGKTTLATWACDRVRERFPGGVLWVELGQRPSQQHLVTMLADLVARLTGESPPAYATVPVAADAFAAALAGRQVLLVVDDAWAGADVEPFLRGEAGCVRLVTTRRPPVVSGREIRVDVMGSGEASTLLRRELSDSTTEDVAPLLSRAGGWPLALALLGGALHSLHERHGLPVAEAVGELLSELDQRGVGALDEFAEAELTRPVATTLALSLDELAASVGRDTMDRYVSLAAFPGGRLVPYLLLSRVWGLGTLRVRAQCDRFLGRSLVVSAGPDGVRLHDVLRDQLRRGFPDRMHETSAALLDASRPAGGWHALPAGDDLWPQLAHHLVQSGRRTELGGLLRDLRFLVSRLRDGPLALESDGGVHGEEEGYGEALLAMLRSDGHLLAGHGTRADLALTLHSRLLSRPGLVADIAHVADELPPSGLVAERPLPDVHDATVVRVLSGHGAPVEHVVWLPDGNLAAVGRGGAMLIWNATTGERVNALGVSPSEVLQARLNPTGGYLAMVVGGGEDPADVRCWIRVVDTAGEVTESPFLLTPGASIEWSPDGYWMAVADGERGLWLWSPFEDRPARPLLRNTLAVGIAWHPELGVTTTTGPWGMLLWWPDPIHDDHHERWDLQGVLRGPARPLAWQPGGELLALVHRGGVTLVEPGRRRVAWRRNAEDVSVISWRPDGQALAVGQGSSVFLWDRDGSPLWDRDGSPRVPTLVGMFDHRVSSIAWHPLNELLAIVTSDFAIRLVDARLFDPWPRRPSTDPLGPISVAWHPDGRILVIEGAEGPARLTARLVDAAEPDSPVWSTVLDIWLPRGTAWSPTGRYLAVGDNPRMVRVRDGETGMVLKEIPGIEAIGWLASGRLAVRRIREQGGTEVVLVDTEDGGQDIAVDIVGDRQGGAGAVVASPDGALLAVCHDEYGEPGLTLVDTATKARMLLDEAKYYFTGCFVAGTERLVTADTEGELTLWDVPSRTAVARTPWSAFQLTASGPSVVAIGRAGHIALFDAATLDRICRIRVNGTLRACALDPGGTRLAVAGSAGLYLFEVRRSG